MWAWQSHACGGTSNEGLRGCKSGGAQGSCIDCCVLLATTAVNRCVARSRDKQIHEFVDRCSHQSIVVHAQPSDRTLTDRRKSPREIRLELFDQHRNALAAATWMADRIFDLDWTGACAIAETDLHRIGVRSRRAIEQQLRIARLFT